MNLSKLSNIYQFLHSPRSWLHVKHKNHKIIYVFLQLIIVPHTKLIYIIIIFIITCITLKSIYLPMQIRQDLCLIVTFLLSILIINIYYTTQNVHVNDHIIKVQPLNSFYNFIQAKNLSINKFLSASFSIPISTIRLILISLIYILTIKIFLLTTNYEEVITSLLNYQNYFIITLNSKIPFIIILSSQFLKMIFKHINKLKTAYLIRNINFRDQNPFCKNLYIYFFMIRSFAINFYIDVKFTTKTLYSRDLLNKDLYIVNIYN